MDRLRRAPVPASNRRHGAQRHPRPKALQEAYRPSSRARPLRADGTPCPAVALYQSIGFRWPFASCGVKRQSIDAILRPAVEHRLYDGPARFDRIGALKQTRVPEHAIVQQRLVTVARRGLEVIAIF